MLPRPQAQVDILRYLTQGRAFMAEITARRRHLGGAETERPLPRPRRPLRNESELGSDPRPEAPSVVGPDRRL